MVEHVNIPDAELHEPKSIAGASSGEVYVADGAGSGVMTSTDEIVRMGVWDYNDDATSSSAISITPVDTDVELTNDGVGAFTNKTYKLSDVADPWDTSTNRFDFTEFSLGDVLDIRFDISITTTVTNTDTVLKLNLAIGGTAYSLVIDQSSFKSAGTYQLTKMFSVYMGDSNTLDNPASVTLSSDSGSTTCVVNGWYIKGLKKGLS